MKMKKQRILSILLSIVCFLFLLPMEQLPVQAASTVLEPYVLETADEKNQMKAKIYSFTSDGEALIPIKIPKNGSVVMKMYVENYGFINMQLYPSAATDTLPSAWSCQCTGDLGNRGTTMRYFEKGTYYIRFPANKYEISLVLYANRSQTVKSGNLISGYADYHHPVYYKYKAPKDGYITIETTSVIDTFFLPDVTLCNSKKKAITDSKRNHESSDKIVYAVKKNTTYQIKVTSNDPYGSQYYQFRMTYTERSENSGSKKSNAVSIKLGKSTSGLVFAEDKTSTEDWYKIKITKKQNVKLYYSGSITSGSMLFDVYDAKGKQYANYSVVANVGTKDEDSLDKKGSISQLPKGTYYIRVKKTRKTSSGIYTIRLDKEK